jgi:hypothetical protein
MVGVSGVEGYGSKKDSGDQTAKRLTVLRVYCR